MKKPKYFLPVMLLLLTIGGLTLNGCAASQEADPTPLMESPDGSQQITPTDEMLGGEDEGGEGEQTNGEGLDPTSTTSDTAQEDVPEGGDEVNQCVDCHTDKQALIDTAAPVVEVEEESEGEG